MGKRETQNKRSFEHVEQDDDPMNGIKTEQVDESNNNSGDKSAQLKRNMKKSQQLEQAIVKPEDEEFEDADDEEQDDEEDLIEEEEEIEEEVEEEEEDEDEDEGNEAVVKIAKSESSQNEAQASSGQQNSGSSNAGAGNADKRPRLTDELYEMNLRRKKEHVGSALYIPFPKKVTEEEVRAFVGQGPNIFLVGPQKQNAIVRYRTRSECEKQQAALAGKEFEGQKLNIEPKTVKIDPANIDVRTLIVQYSNPDLTIMDFAQIFIKAISISLKGSKSKKESQEDLSFGSAIIIFTSHDDAKEAFLATENLNIKGEQLRVVFADFRPAAGPRPAGFRDKDGANNRGNFNRGNNQGGVRQGGGGGGGGNFRNRSRQGGNRSFGNRNFNQNSGGDRGGNYNQGGGGGGRNYSPNKKFRSNVR